jgi:hypothetical protein
MDTSILHTRIQEFKAKAKHPTSKEMIILFESWFAAIENYTAGIEIDNFAAHVKIRQLQETINILTDLLIITGHAEIFTLDFKDDHVRQAIEMLLKSKDRKNANEISGIATMLYINSDKKFESLKHLMEYVNGHQI